MGSFFKKRPEDVDRHIREKRFDALCTTYHLLKIKKNRGESYSLVCVFVCLLFVCVLAFVCVCVGGCSSARSVSVCMRALCVCADRHMREKRFDALCATYHLLK